MAGDSKERVIEAGRPSVLGTTAETLLATAVALFLSLRLASPLVWLFLPLALLVPFGRSLSEHGFDLRVRPPSITVHATLGVSLLGLYAVLHAWVAHAFLRQTLVPRLPRHLLLDLVREFLTVGFPEEAFFRGYLQTRWNQVLGKPWRVFGASIGAGLLLQAILFAACHVVGGDWTRLRVFFFALIAGWLRERSDSVLAPAVYHATANVWYRVLLTSFR
ncbi:MAG TPA: CPBP family intramembrane glutamic endopeptidase [Candidatus Binatia bacterium]|nr:CPBP family intramembrane glutamic endopeptidase [Candidatus Binatia bacterium]